MGRKVSQVSRKEMRAAAEKESGGSIDVDVDADVDMDGEEADEEALEVWRTPEGWWKRCGRCDHGWEGEEVVDDGGHVWGDDVSESERRRRGKVVGRIEELLQVCCTLPRWRSDVSFELEQEVRTTLINTQDDDLLTTFPTPHPESIASLMNQLHHFIRPSGKKPVSALPPGMTIDMASPNGSGSGTPFTPREDGDTGTPGDALDERPRKRRRNGRAGTAGTGSEHSAADPDEETGSAHVARRRKDGDAASDGVDENGTVTGLGHQGKRPGGKSAGKGTMPRTVVRGVRGLVPMEMDAEGNQHVAGNLPDSALSGNKEKQIQDGVKNTGGEAPGDAGDEDDDGEADVPLAQRPQLDIKEKRRRELQKEKAREREAEVVQRLTQGVSVDEGVGAVVLDDKGEAVDVENWEGVELVGVDLDTRCRILLCVHIRGLC